VSLERTYQIEEPPEEALAWKDYESIIATEWAGLLNSNPPPPEPAVQAFFELHPSMVPGAFGLLGNESGHYPSLCGLITQPPLPSYNRRVPDFMWLSQGSDTEQPILVEIEAPAKRWFTKLLIGLDSNQLSFNSNWKGGGTGSFTWKIYTRASLGQRNK